MKCVYVCVLALCALASAYPRDSREESKEDDSSDAGSLYIVPLERSGPRRSFGAGAFDISEDLEPPSPFEHPFFRGSWGQTPEDSVRTDDFMTQMQEMLKEMRKQLTEIISHRHPELDGGDSGVSVGTKIGEGDLPSNKSTSTTKVIDGHVVTVNETTYSSGDDNIGAVFRIKIVEVHPDEDSEGEVKPAGSEDESPEVEDKSEGPSTKNSLPEAEPTTSKSELEEDHHEETNEIPNQKVHDEWSSEFNPSFNEIDDSEDEFAVHKFSPVKKENYYDMRGDTKVNDYVSDQALSQGLVMIDPDAELVHTGVDSYYHYDREPQRMQEFQ